MQTEGFSYYQRSRLDDIAKRITKQEEEVEKKVERQLEYVPDIAKLVSKDDAHTTKIENLKNIKVVRSDYESKMAQLDGDDNNRHTTLNTLDNAYGQKASKMVFDNVVTELRALDDNHEMRLDELEKRLGATQVDLDDRITQELNQKINSDEFKAMLANVNAGQTGLAQDIANLLMTPEMLQLNADQDAQIALKADKAQFDTDTAAIASRHYDFEKRFLAIDQFFRLMNKTYKIYEDVDNNENEIVYDANFKSEYAEAIFSIMGKKTEFVQTRSITSTTYVDKLVVKLTTFGYNTFTGQISVYDENNNLIGSVDKSGVNPILLTADINLSTTNFNAVQARQLTSDGAALYSNPPLTSTDYNNNLTDLTPVDIKAVNLSIDSFINTDVSLENDIQGTGVITVVPALPSGISAAIVNRKLIISGKTAQVIDTDQSYTLTVTGSSNSKSITFSIRMLEKVPTYTYNTSYTFTKNQVISIEPVLVNGDAATTWSITSVSSLTNIELSFNTSTGAISGTANGTLTNTSFTVTYGNSGGTNTVTFSLTVNPLPPLYTYSPSTITAKVDDNINIVPALTVGNYDAATTWSISPAIAANTGLTFNTSTGVVSGKAAAILTTTAYTVSYSNSAGSNTATFTLTIDSLVTGLERKWARYAGSGIAKPVIDSAGNIYNITISTTGTNNLIKYNSSGAFMSQFSFPSGTSAHNLICYGDKIIVTCEKHIQKFSNTLVSEGIYNLPTGVYVTSAIAGGNSIFNGFFIAGYSWNVSTPSFGGNSLEGTYSGGKTNAFIMKLNSDLVPNWGKWIGYYCRVAALVVDDANAVIASVANETSTFVPTLPGVTTDQGSGNITAVKFNSNGMVILSKRISVIATDIDDNRNIYGVFNTIYNTNQRTSIMKFSEDFSYVLSALTPLYNGYTHVGASLGLDKSSGDTYIFATTNVPGNGQGAIVVKFNSAGQQIHLVTLNTGGKFVGTNTTYSPFNKDVIVTGNIMSTQNLWANYSISNITNLNTSSLSGSGASAIEAFTAALKSISI